MDPHYMDFSEVNSSTLPLQHKKNCEIRVDFDLFKSIKGLGWGSSLVLGGGGGGGWGFDRAVWQFIVEN